MIDEKTTTITTSFCRTLLGRISRSVCGSGVAQTKPSGAAAVPDRPELAAGLAWSELRSGYIPYLAMHSPWRIIYYAWIFDRPRLRHAVFWIFRVLYDVDRFLALVGKFSVRGLRKLRKKTNFRVAIKSKVFQLMLQQNTFVITRCCQEHWDCC